MTCVIQAKWGVVDSDDGRSSAVGRNILQRGGNAVDAAVAVALTLGVINQGSSGLGGGSFMLVRMHDGRAQGFDMRETAPAAAKEDLYRKNIDLKRKDPMSVAVPGELKGLYEAWRMFGSKSIYIYQGLEWKELVQPAIHFAEEGFTISPYLRYQMHFVQDDILKDPGMRDIYTRNGKLLNAGDVCKIPRLAETLKAIADKGPDEFYYGQIGAKIVQDIKHSGKPSILEITDLKNYKVKLREPIAAKIEAMGLNFLTMPPPASGVQEFCWWHICTDDEKAIIKDHGTSHMSIVDSQRNAVSLTTSVNYYFGSRFLSPSTGILLNNTMDDFVDPDIPNPANRIEPNKRPLSSMNPTIIMKGRELKVVVGSSGGVRIPAGTAQVVLNHFARENDILSSIMQPRLFHQLIPNELEYEKWTTAKGYHFEIPQSVLKYLVERGHELKLIEENNMCQFMDVPLDVNSMLVTAASDPRKGSYPDGY